MSFLRRWRRIFLLAIFFPIIALIAALAYQLKMVLPYTFIWKKQVKQVRQNQLNSKQQISVIVSNVLT
ncbi:MAG: hypothetical protein RR060_07815, partial [Victivallaceae bacterium]